MNAFLIGYLCVGLVFALGGLVLDLIEAQDLVEPDWVVVLRIGLFVLVVLSWPFVVVGELRRMREK